MSDSRCQCGNFFFTCWFVCNWLSAKRLMITLCKHCVGVMRKCDTWNSDVDSEQPLKRIYWVPVWFRHILRDFSKLSCGRWVATNTLNTYVIARRAAVECHISHYPRITVVLKLSRDDRQRVLKKGGVIRMQHVNSLNSDLTKVRKVSKEDEALKIYCFSGGLTLMKESNFSCAERGRMYRSGALP